jgi:hypothetical protein
MDAKAVLQFQLNGSFNLLAEVAKEATDAEWRSRPFRGANLLGFTIWHGARTIDWAVNWVLREDSELADGADWSDLCPAGSVFGAGVSRDAADAVALEIPRTRVLDYIEGLGAQVIPWLSGLASEELTGSVDLRARQASKPEYMAPAVWGEIEDLNGIPKWQFLARPCVSHIRVHYGEAKSQLEGLRTAPAS